MKKLLLTLQAISTLLFLICSVERNNPLDEQGDHFIAPTFEVDTSESSIIGNDTIHFDSGTAVLAGNNSQSRFQAKVDTSKWSGWQDQDTGVFHFAQLSDGRHTVYIETKYSGGDLVVGDSIVFFVRVAGYKPNYGQMRDSAITTDTGKTILLKDSATGASPILYQWLKGGTVLKGQTGDSLVLNNVKQNDTGLYTCVASNIYGADTGRIYTIEIVNQSINSSLYTLTVQLTAGGMVTRSLTKTGYAANEILWVKAVPDSGYDFDYWDGDIASNSDSLSFTISKNTTLRAVFSPTITGACRELAPGENITAAIKGVIKTQKQGLLCIQSGLYNIRAVRTNGQLRIVVKRN